MEDVRLAVIMSVYKGDELRYTRMAVESIQQQTYAAFRCYILFDGEVSGDIDAYLSALEDERFVLIRNDSNRGLAKALNQMLGLILHDTSIQYIARMDADDFSAPMRFERQIAFLCSHPDTDCVGTWAIEVDAKGNEFCRKQMPCTHQECYEFFAKRDCMIHPTVMFRQSFFEKAGLYPEDTYFGEDTILWAQGFAAGCRFANLPEYLYYFRLNEHFFDRRRGIKHARSIIQLRKKVNRMLHYGLKADMYALLYALAKLMPSPVLNILYKTIR